MDYLPSTRHRRYERISVMVYFGVIKFISCIACQNTAEASGFKPSRTSEEHNDYGHRGQSMCRILLINLNGMNIPGTIVGLPHHLILLNTDTIHHHNYSIFAYSNAIF